MVHEYVMLGDDTMVPLDGSMILREDDTHIGMAIHIRYIDTQVCLYGTCMVSLRYVYEQVC